MINHFRTKLMNITWDDVASEFIDPEFNEETLPAVFSNFRALIFPTVDRDEIVLRANAYTNLLHSFGLDYVFTFHDKRITYTPEELVTFQSSVSDLAAVANAVILSEHSQALFNHADPQDSLRNMFEQSPYDLQRLAAAIAAYSLKLS